MSVFLVLVVAALVVKWHERPAKESPALVTETVPAGMGKSFQAKEPRINFEGRLVSMGYQVDGIELGTERSRVEESTGPTSSWTTANFPNGIKGKFPRYSEGEDSLRVAYDRQNRVYCLWGNTLSLPDGEVFLRYSRVSMVEAALGEAPATDPYENGVHLHYPELGLSFDFYNRTVGREMEMRSVFLSPPWDPEE